MSPTCTFDTVFNNADAAYMPRPGACTHVGCIDDTPVVGTPALISGGTSAGPSLVAVFVLIVLCVVVGY